MTLKLIEQDALQPNGKRGLAARASFAVCNENATEAEQRLGELEGSTGSSSAQLLQHQQKIDALQAGANSASERLDQAGASLLSEVQARLEGDEQLRAQDVQLQADMNAVAARTGKNRFINGALRIWQRRYGGSVGVGGAQGITAFYADRFVHAALQCKQSITRIEVAGNHPLAESVRYSMIIEVTGATAASGAWFGQKIDGVRSVNGQVSISVNINAARDNCKVGVRVIQSYGSGGGASQEVVTIAGALTVDVAAKRHTITATLPSTKGKTIGTSGTDHVYVVFDLCGTGNDPGMVGQNAMFAFSEFQIEEGHSATQFEYVHLGTDLALCQLYWRQSYTHGVVAGTSNQDAGRIATGFQVAGAAAPSLTAYSLRFPTPMRAPPAIVIYSAVSGAAGRITMSDNSDGSGAPTVRGINAGGAEVNWSNNASTFGGWFHYTADAEL